MSWFFTGSEKCVGAGRLSRVRTALVTACARATAELAPIGTKTERGTTYLQRISVWIRFARSCCRLNKIIKNEVLVTGFSTGTRCSLEVIDALRRKNESGV